MEETQTQAMERKLFKGLQFTEDDKDILIMAVKIAQGRGVKGTKGNWTEYIQGREGMGTAIDPVHKKWNVLADFVKTFTNKSDVKIARRLKNWKERQHKLSSLQGQFGTSPALELVHQTYQHCNFKKLYSFASYHEGWFVTKMAKSEDSSGEERIIALDCEMVRCEDGSEEVVKVCVVDEDLKTLLDMTVKPTKPVSDYISNITGIKAEDLEGVEHKHWDVQKALKKLLKPNTIIAGHSLFHDLKVLRVDHPKIIDTACIFRYQNMADTYIPSLSKLCKAVLNYDMREEGKPHVCLDDAVTVMKLIQAKLTRGINFPIDIGNLEVSEEDLSKLLIHKISRNVSLDDLQKLFPNHSVTFNGFSDGNKKFRCTMAAFETPEKADEAFDILTGELAKDQLGRLQKCVTISTLSNAKNGRLSTVFVRKMTSEEAIENAKTTSIMEMENKLDGNIPNLSDVDMSEISCDKKRKKSTISSSIEAHNEQPRMTNSCICIHLKENEDLKNELKEKEQEIIQLRTIINTLTKMNGL